MPIPGTDIETTAEFAGRMIRDAAAENERLRELLAIARSGLFYAEPLMAYPHQRRRLTEDLRRSDPEVK